MKNRSTCTIHVLFLRTLLASVVALGAGSLLGGLRSGKFDGRAGRAQAGDPGIRRCAWRTAACLGRDHPALHSWDWRAQVRFDAADRNDRADGRGRQFQHHWKVQLQRRDPGLHRRDRRQSRAGSNSAVSLSAALGPCSSLTSSTFIMINEVTTIAAAYALAPFAADLADIGASGSNPTGLVSAFANAGLLANVAAGTAGGASLPAGVSVPVSEIDTLGDILAACINSSGPSSSSCTTLFTATGANETFGASLAIARNPGAPAITRFTRCPLLRRRSSLRLRPARPLTITRWRSAHGEWRTGNALRHCARCGRRCLDHQRDRHDGDRTLTFGQRSGGADCIRSCGCRRHCDRS